MTVEGSTCIPSGPYKILRLCTDHIIPEPRLVSNTMPCIDLRPGVPESFIVARMDHQDPSFDQSRFTLTSVQPKLH